jgi:ribosome recycling factor
LTHSVPQKLPSQCLNAPRSFTHTSITYKKGGKAAREEKHLSTAEKSSTVEDPYDFSTLEAGIQKTLTKLQDDLSKLRTGGRFNPELLEGVRVQLKKDNKQSIRLGDLAQVVPKGGKSVVVLVGEADVSRIVQMDFSWAPNNISMICSMSSPSHPQSRARKT